MVDPASLFAAINDTVPWICWQRRRIKVWLSEATLLLVRLNWFCYRKLKKLLTPANIITCIVKCMLLQDSTSRYMLTLLLMIFVIDKKSSGVGSAK